MVMRPPGLNDPRLGDPKDPLKLTKEKYDYIMRMAKLPGREHLAEQIDHENMRWKGDFSKENK